ncbi:putative membrane protein [Sphingomonas sp. S17]|nr:putative membrane protein [Sphingomonas sp. S17]
MAAMALLAAVPLLWPTVPPLVDLAGHMGRYRVQLEYADQPWLAQWYHFEWQMIGNLGIDLLIEPLAPIFGLELAVKLIVIAIPVLTVTGLLWIAREVQGRIPATALFALPLAYSYPFQFGFVNFALSMALALNLFALWLRMGRLGAVRLRMVLFVPLSCLLWLAHTFGWGVLGVLAFSAELIRQHDIRRARGARGLKGWVESAFHAGIGCIPLALPMVLMVLWRSGEHVTGQTGDWFNWRWKINWVTMALRDRWMAFDLASVTVLFLVLLKGVRDERVEYSRNLVLSAAFLAVVYVLLPRIVFGSAYADMRLAPYVLAIALIALRPRRGLSFRGASTLAIVGLLFFVVRIGATTVSYVMYSNDYDRVLTALDHVPPRARLLTFVGRQYCADVWPSSRLEHVAGLALERKLAYANDQWSMAGGQLLTVRYAPAKRFAHDPSEIVTQRRCRGQWWRPIETALKLLPRDAFDYVWLVHPPRYDEALTRGMTPIWRSGRDVLYRIDDRRPIIDPTAYEILSRPNPEDDRRPPPARRSTPPDKDDD